METRTVWARLGLAYSIEQRVLHRCSNFHLREWWLSRWVFLKRKEYAEAAGFWSQLTVLASQFEDRNLCVYELGYCRFYKSLCSCQTQTSRCRILWLLTCLHISRGRVTAVAAMAYSMGTSSKYCHPSCYRVYPIRRAFVNPAAPVQQTTAQTCRQGNPKCTGLLRTEPHLLVSWSLFGGLLCIRTP